MFTTPERSLHRPPRPVMAMGTASAMDAATVPLESMSSAPVTTRTSETRNSATKPPSTHSRGPNRRRRALAGAAAGGAPAAALTDVLMLGPRGAVSGTRKVLGMPSCRHLLGTGAAGRQLRGHPALLVHQAVPPDQLVGDHDRQHDHSLHDLHAPR